MHRNHSRGGVTPTVVLAVALAALIVAPSLPDDADRQLELRPPTGWINQLDGKWIHKGWFDGYQIDPQLPSHWYFVEDDATDGSGVTYAIYHTSFVEPGPANPSVDGQTVFRPAVNVTTLQEAIDYIVQNNGHVNSSSELLAHKHVISLP